MTEVIIYQAGSAYTAEQAQSAHNFSVLPVIEGKKGNSPTLSIWFLKIAKILAVAGAALVIYAYAPSVWYWAGSGVGNFVNNFSLSQTEVQRLTTIPESEKVKYEPAFDPKLPEANLLSVSSIGVNTNIQEATLNGYQEALKKGVWRVSDFGAPNASGRPVIPAAHRFGYLAWSNAFRHKNSFYNLPKVKTGDVVSIVWRQRKYTYEVYATETAKEIGDYSADLILYTCEKLNGPMRIFVYARLIQV